MVQSAKALEKAATRWAQTFAASWKRTLNKEEKKHVVQMFQLMQQLCKKFEQQPDSAKMSTKDRMEAVALQQQLLSVILPIAIHMQMELDTKRGAQAKKEGEAYVRLFAQVLANVSEKMAEEMAA